MIKTITISGFKALKNLTLDLTTLNAIVGVNDSGKSSILQAIHLAVSIAQTRKLLGEAGDKEVAVSAAEMLYTPIQEFSKLLSQDSCDDVAAIRIELTLQAGSTDHQAVFEIKPGDHRTILTSMRGEYATSLLGELEKPFSLYVPGLSGLARAEREVSFGMLRRVVAHGDSNLVLRNVLSKLYADPSARERFILLLGQVFPDILVNVRFETKIDEFIQVDVEHGGRVLPLDACGNGLLQAVHISSYIALFQPTVLLLDEPDSHLHPNNQRALLRMLTSLTDAGSTQVILATHSRHVLDSIRDHGKLFWIDKGAFVEGIGANLTARMLELGAFDSLDYFANGSLKCLVATEDENQEYLKALLWSSGFLKEETAVVSFLGSSNIPSALVFQQFLQQKAPNVKLVIHRDRDYMSNEEVNKLEQSMTTKGIEPFVTDPSDVEGYFCSAHLIQSRAGISAELAKKIVSDAVDAVRDASISAMVNLRIEHANKASKGGSRVAPGPVSVGCHKEYDANELNLVRGKLCFGEIKSRVRQEVKPAPDLLSDSPHLNVAKLNAIAKRIWGENIKGM